jgi:hypothetical protein
MRITEKCPVFTVSRRSHPTATTWNDPRFGRLKFYDETVKTKSATLEEFRRIRSKFPQENTLRNGQGEDIKSAGTG